MIPVALILVAAASHVDLVDDVFQIPAGQWWYQELGLRQRPVLVSAEFDVRSGSHDLQIALMRREDMVRFRKDLPPGVLAKTDRSGSGRLRYQILAAGDYVFVITNHDGAKPAEVHLRVALDFLTISRLPLTRQITVIAISFAVFFAIAGLSARRLLRGIRR